MAWLFVVGFVLVGTVAVVHLLGLALRAADLGTVDLQRAVTCATLGCAFTLPGHMPPGESQRSEEARVRIKLKSGGSQTNVFLLARNPKD